jgi:hypothetical protein
MSSDRKWNCKSLSQYKSTEYPRAGNAVVPRSVKRIKGAEM